MNPNNPTSVLYDPASPNALDPFKSPVISIDRLPFPQSINPKLDMDNPGLNTLIPQSPVPYGNEHEDLPSSSFAIQEALLSVNTAADQRALNVKAPFGLIAGSTACQTHICQISNELSSPFMMI